MAEHDVPVEDHREVGEIVAYAQPRFGRFTLKSVHGLNERANINALPRAVVVTDAGGRIVLWNGAAESLYGWGEQDVVGMSIADVLAPPEELAVH